jgi:hypothetical protein
METMDEVQRKVAALLGLMQGTKAIDLSPIPNMQKYDRDLLLGYWKAFGRYFSGEPFEKIMLSDRPIPYGREEGLLAAAWQFDVHLKPGHHFPLVLFEAFNQACSTIGYNPFFWRFNRGDPFEEKFAQQGSLIRGLGKQNEDTVENFQRQVAQSIERHTGEKPTLEAIEAWCQIEPLYTSSRN